MSVLKGLGNVLLFLARIGRSVFVGAWRVMFSVIRGVGPRVMRMARMIMWAGRLIGLSPIGVALGLLAVAGYLIYKNWDGIVGGLKAIWENLKKSVLEFFDSPVKACARLAMLPVTVLEYFAGIASGMLQCIVDLKIPFVSVAAELIQGILDGIASKAKALKDGVVNLASDVAGWFKERLGISSPSRVFLEFGGFISEDEALGIERGQQLASRAALALAAATMAPVGMAAGLPAAVGNMTPTALPPLKPAASAARSGAASGAGARIGASTYTITINAQPGMDAQAIARAVSAELDRRERASHSRVISQMADTE